MSMPSFYDADVVLGRTTHSDVFIDFATRRYIAGYVPDMASRSLLVNAGFTVVDEAIADIVMRLNSAGYETISSCSGHMGRTGSHIVFCDSYEEANRILTGVPYWRSAQLEVCGMQAAHMEWSIPEGLSECQRLEALCKLGAAVSQLSNNFAEWRFVNVTDHGRCYIRTGIEPVTNKEPGA